MAPPPLPLCSLRFWFHHAAVDRMRVQWQHRNKELRSLAWGYFAISSYSTSTRVSNSCPVDLGDVIGAGPNTRIQPMLWSQPPSRDRPMFGVGFDLERLMGRSDDGMQATVAAPMRHVDMLCGDVEALYTYDVLVDEKLKDAQEASERRVTRAVAVVALLVALAGAALLAGPTQRVLFGPPEAMKPMRTSNIDEYDMKINEAANKAYVEHQQA